MMIIFLVSENGGWNYNRNRGGGGGGGRGRGNWGYGGMYSLSLWQSQSSLLYRFLHELDLTSLTCPSDHDCCLGISSNKYYRGSRLFSLFSSVVVSFLVPNN